MDADRRWPVLDLFAGMGTWTLVLETLPGFYTIGFSEVEPYAVALLQHHWPDIPQLGAVQGVTRDSVLRQCGELPIVVTGSFPCQPHSHAGKRLASADERDLWGECVRVLRDLRPRVALFENVPGLLTSESGLFFNRVVSDLAEIGFACQWETLSAAAVGAPHKRERIWLLCWDELAHGAGGGRDLAHPDGNGGGEDCEPGQLRAVGPLESPGDCGAPDQAQGDQGPEGATGFWPAAHGLWPARPGEAQYEWEYARTVTGEVIARLGGATDGTTQPMDGAPVPLQKPQAGTMNRTHQLKALGNGIVPACAVPFALAIRDYLEGTDAR